MTDALTDRIERLLTLVEESRRTNQLLGQQVQMLRAERDNLQQRLESASQRIDAILQRIPPTTIKTTTPSPSKATDEYAP
jgi:cell division protein ZapB